METGYSEGFCHETGEAKGGVTGRVFLVVGGFVGLVDNNQTEVLQGREEGGTGADDDFGGIAREEVFPDLVALGFGLF